MHNHACSPCTLLTVQASQPSLDPRVHTAHQPNHISGRVPAGCGSPEGSSAQVSALSSLLHTSKGLQCILFQNLESCSVEFVGNVQPLSVSASTLCSFELFTIVTGNSLSCYLSSPRAPGHVCVRHVPGERHNGSGVGEGMGDVGGVPSRPL